MEHNKEYYNDLVVYELKTERWNFDAWEAIHRMVKNPYVLDKQEILFENQANGHYMVKVTQRTLDAMKEVIQFQRINKIEDEKRKFAELIKKYHPQWA